MRYGFWYNSNGNVIFGLVGIPPAMEVQYNWIGCCLSPNVSTILVLHGMVTTMLVQFLRLVDVPTLLEVKKIICSVWNPNVSTIINLVGFLYPNVSTIFYFAVFVPKC